MVATAAAEPTPAPTATSVDEAARAALLEAANALQTELASLRLQVQQLRQKAEPLQGAAGMSEDAAKRQWLSKSGF